MATHPDSSSEPHPWRPSLIVALGHAPDVAPPLDLAALQASFDDERDAIDRDDAEFVARVRKHERIFSNIILAAAAMLLVYMLIGVVIALRAGRL